jgi:hypothetical protein
VITDIGGHVSPSVNRKLIYHGLPDILDRHHSFELREGGQTPQVVGSRATHFWAPGYHVTRRLGCDLSQKLLAVDASILAGRAGDQRLTGSEPSRCPAATQDIESGVLSPHLKRFSGVAPRPNQFGNFNERA